MKKLLTFFLVVAFCNFAIAQNVKKRPVWKASNFHGISIEKSKKSDLRRLFGKPRHIFNPEDEYDNPILSMISYDYENLAGFQGRTIFNMEKRDGIIQDIILRPSEKKPLDYNWMVLQFGKDYIKRLNDPCPKGKEPFNNRDKSTKSGSGFYLYYSKGFYVLIDSQDKINEIVYLKTCS